MSLKVDARIGNMRAAWEHREGGVLRSQLEEPWSGRLSGRYGAFFPLFVLPSGTFHSALVCDAIVYFANMYDM